MSNENSDRRVQRTRNALRSALVELINEKAYDAITIQDITERANVGRTTFYLHYQSKDELLLDHHDHFLRMLDIGIWSREELLIEAEASGLIQFLDRISAGRGFYMAIISSKDADMILRGMQEQMVNNLTESLALAFPEQESRLPLVILCNYVAGAQLTLIKWWMSTRNEYPSMQIAHMIQRLQYVAIKDAYGL